MTAADTVKTTENRPRGVSVADGDQRSASAGLPAPEQPGERHTAMPGSAARARGEQVVLLATILVPFAALVAAVPLLWGRWISWRDVVLAAVMYAITGHGVTIGFHRYFTHRGFKTSRPVRAALAIAGNMAIEGPVIRWVADHRRHHAFSDAEGDPHSPWRYGTGPVALARGLWHSHIGWLFDVEQTDQRRYAPDLLDDPMIVRISHSFALCAFVSLAVPPLVGGLWGGSFEAAVQAFFWASLVRVALLHHVTWSVNSICHVLGSRPYRSRDRSGNVWPLALLSMGESWHNLHHAEPTSARHGVRPWQVDTSFYGIKLLETLRLVWDVRWPDPERLAGKRV
ncbi:acyl-CoA desaturase [Frankia sp. CcI49]|nr:MULTISPECIES: fatty acid desaturase [unclassified Frankia]KPM57523.1 stearoyl-CoA 9-desaturase [Frankia sp. R43]ONH58120.1 acyl-CoA desaturase [Frankia sp. CcI49]